MQKVKNEKTYNKITASSVLGLIFLIIGIGLITSGMISLKYQLGNFQFMYRTLLFTLGTLFVIGYIFIYLIYKNDFNNKLFDNVILLSLLLLLFLDGTMLIKLLNIIMKLKYSDKQKNVVMMLI